MVVTISSALLERIVAHAASSPDEVCGLLMGTTAAIADAVPTVNVAATPARRFEIDPVALIAAHRAARAGGPRLIGHYHSHPTGMPRPSARDAADAEPDGAIWLIVAGYAAQAFRAVQDGEIEGRFQFVLLEVDGSSHDRAHPI